MAFHADKLTRKQVCLAMRFIEVIKPNSRIQANTCLASLQSPRLALAELTGADAHSAAEGVGEARW